MSSQGRIQKLKIENVKNKECVHIWANCTSLINQSNIILENFQVRKFDVFPLIMIAFYLLITKDNKIFELQILLEHNDLANKFATKTIDAMLLFQLVQLK